MAETFNYTSINMIHDKYGGITLDNSTIPNDVKAFEIELLNITKNVRGNKLLWINIPIEKAHVIPLLTKFNFVFHHCSERDVTMVKKLINNSIIPTAINHTLGVGAVVIDDSKLLVIKDRIWKKYKLPGGYVDNNENLSIALQREVLEETGINVKLDSIVSLAHSSHSQFEKSNLYVVCNATPLSKEIQIVDSSEIIEAKWINIDVFFDCEDIHIYNKNLVKTAMKARGLKLENYIYFADSDNHHEYFF